MSTILVVGEMLNQLQQQVQWYQNPLQDHVLILFHARAAFNVSILHTRLKQHWRYAGFEGLRYLIDCNTMIRDQDLHKLVETQQPSYAVSPDPVQMANSGKWIDFQSDWLVLTLSQACAYRCNRNDYCQIFQYGEFSVFRFQSGTSADLPDYSNNVCSEVDVYTTNNAQLQQSTCKVFARYRPGTCPWAVCWWMDNSNSW